ncbi:MAG: aminopeptidase P family N-terminal domain-containing protein [Bacillota bacterium]|nr:aminopeptidase P family N-terminal domain-containing protein [Bacillota bacterium]
MKRDYEKRMENLQKNIVAESLDAMLITSQESIYYLTGADYDPVERPFFIIAKKEGVPMLVVPKMEFAHMSKVGNFGKIDYYEEFPTREGACWYDKLNLLLADAAIKVLGIEPSLPSGNMQKIQADEIRISSCIEDTRVKKLPDEIEALRESAKYSAEGIRLLHKGLYVGQTVLDRTWLWNERA